MTESTDNAVRFLFEHAAVRGIWVRLNDSYRDTLQHHSYGQTAKKMLGESLAAAVLMSRTIKLQGRLALQARGDAALRLLVAECTHDAAVRGMIDLDDLRVDINPAAAHLQSMIGSGYLAVTLLPDDGESYQGIVPLQGARLQDCLEDYFLQSEQLPTALWLVSDGEQAVGLLLQALPSGQDDEKDKDDEDWRRLRMLASTLTDAELLSLPCEELLHRLFHEETVRLFDPEPVHFACTCSRERSLQALAVLGRDDLQKLFVEQTEVSIDCQFCRQTYRYVIGDVADILDEPPGLLH
jgi:molecular chaperone Hsp33